jgi:hypothetical protein
VDRNIPVTHRNRRRIGAGLDQWTDTIICQIVQTLVP